MQEQEKDPITCYLIVRKSLGMSIGKTAAQCCHGIQYIMDIRPIRAEDTQLVKDWKSSGSRKVILEADEKEWAALKMLNGVERKIVRDHGLTELEPGTETVIGLFPMPKSQAPKIVKRLQTLK